MRKMNSDKLAVEIGALTQQGWSPGLGEYVSYEAAGGGQSSEHMARAAASKGEGG